MNVKEYIQRDIDIEIKHHKEEMAKLNSYMQMAEQLPIEIQSFNDCGYVYGYVGETYKELYAHFANEDTINKLKMLGAQGFRTFFAGEYFRDPNKWMWIHGKITFNGITFEFSGGTPPKPPTCVIEEYEEPSKPPEKKMRAICTLTGEKV
jgi:hypothetical protein